MKTNRQQIQVLRQRISHAEAHPGGVRVYCQEQGIKKRQYYYWRESLAKATAARSHSQRQRQTRPKLQGSAPSSRSRFHSSFVPVLLTHASVPEGGRKSSELRPSSSGSRVPSGWPDPGWLAQFLRHFLMGAEQMDQHQQRYSHEEQPS
jgi:hypothetical protein